MLSVPLALSKSLLPQSTRSFSLRGELLCMIDNLIVLQLEIGGSAHPPSTPPTPQLTLNFDVWSPRACMPARVPVPVSRQQSAPSHLGRYSGSSTEHPEHGYTSRSVAAGRCADDVSDPASHLSHITAPFPIGVPPPNCAVEAA